MRSSSWYRLRADEARAVSDSYYHQATKDMMISVADDYDFMANQREEQETLEKAKANGHKVNGYVVPLTKANVINIKLWKTLKT